MGSLLLVEDDSATAEVLRVLLTAAGHEVTRAGDGRAALRAAYQRRPDLVVLDVGLPLLDGWAVLERLRELSDVPVLMLTGHGAGAVRGLRAGADDYLAKPFAHDELVARVEALLRRGGVRRQWRTEIYDDGRLRLDPTAHEVAVDGRDIDLTPTEFRLLEAMVRHPGAVLTPGQLLAQAWGDPAGIGAGRVKFAVLRLRRKLGWREHPSSPLETVRGVGYRYRPPG